MYGVVASSVPGAWVLEARSAPRECEVSRRADFHFGIVQVGVGKRLRFVDVDAVYLNRERAYRAMSALLGDIERGEDDIVLRDKEVSGSVGHALAAQGALRYGLRS